MFVTGVGTARGDRQTEQQYHQGFPHHVSVRRMTNSPKPTAASIE